MGAVRLHDSRPGSSRDCTDEYGYGPLLERRRAGRPLELGDLVRLPDGSHRPVVSSRVWLGPLGWRQAVAIGG